MNIDISPTILDAAGVSSIYGMDGVSMRLLANHSAHRKELFYEYFNRDCKPSLTCVRDFNYKYIHNRCANTVDEFYDLSADPKENINLINAVCMSGIVQDYRDKLDSLKGLYGYELLKDTILPCTMQKPDTCPKPLGLYVSSITHTSATLNWQNQNCNNGYKLQFRMQGQTAWATVKPPCNSNNYHVAGLPGTGVYEWRLAVKCDLADPPDYSKYTAIQTFKTL